MPAQRLSPRKRPRQERARLTVDAILEAAAHVFESEGYAAGTTNRIAARAGVSIGSLYQYFPNKDAILVALVERHVEEGVEAVWPLLVALREQPPPLREGLTGLVSALVELHRHRPALHRVLFEEAPRPPQLQARFDEVAAAGSAVIAGYLRTCPEVELPDPELAARLTVQVVESVTHTLVIHPDREHEPERYVAETVELLYAYLSRPSA
jgi:AcrR family transcriptional regulator